MRIATFLAITFVLSALASTVQAQPTQTQLKQKTGLFTQTSVEKAWKSATSRQTPMLVMFTADNCKFCKKMLNETYGHPGIQRMLSGRTETVLAHANNYRDLTKKLGVRGYPTTLLVSPKGEVLDFMQGFVEPRDFAERVGPILASQKPRTLASATAASHETTER